jgi:hypothetical protein
MDWLCEREMAVYQVRAALSAVARKPARDTMCCMALWFGREYIACWLTSTHFWFVGCGTALPDCHVKEPYVSKDVRFVALQTIFSMSGDAAKLDRFERRFSWFKVSALHCSSGSWQLDALREVVLLAVLAVKHCLPVTRLRCV